MNNFSTILDNKKKLPETSVLVGKIIIFAHQFGS